MVRQARKWLRTSGAGEATCLRGGPPAAPCPTGAAGGRVLAWLARLPALAPLTTLALALSLAACGPPAPPPRAVPRPAVPLPARHEPPSPADAALERAVIAEINRLRADPAAYAEALDALLPLFDGDVLRRPGVRIGLKTREGPAAVREAAEALRATPALPALRREEGLSFAARDHARDLGPRGLATHAGTDGSTTADRAARYGQWRRRLTENLEFGSTTGRFVVIALLVDDAVPDRGHRKNLLDPMVAAVGVGCGPHKQYGRMCVIVQAGEYETR